MTTCDASHPEAEAYFLFGAHFLFGMCFLFGARFLFWCAFPVLVCVSFLVQSATVSFFESGGLLLT
jgi:hypothetical protein